MLNNKRQETQEIGIEKHPELHLVCLLGTFDPPHFGHVRVLSDAMIQISKNNLQESNTVGYLVPIGDKAPGPNGQIWKHGLKNSFDLRHKLCSEMVKPFAPIIKTTGIGKKHPTLFGLELCSILGQSISASSLHIVAGVDTWKRWERSFYDCLQHSPLLANGVVDQINFWVQPLWEEVVAFNIKEIRANTLEPRVPYFIRSHEIRERKLYSLTAIDTTHFWKAYK